MATLKVTAPVSDYSGTVGGVQFADGKASFDPKANPGVLSYFLGAGYKVEGYDANPDPPGRYTPRVAPTAPAPGTPDNPTGIVGGVPPRDAAVDPNPAGPASQAFLPPTNAGRADPHGPDVISPGLHAVPPAPIVPGPVAGDAVSGSQEERETAVAAAVLSEGASVPEVQDAVTRAYREALEGDGGDGSVLDAVADAADTPPDGSTEAATEASAGGEPSMVDVRVDGPDGKPVTREVPVTAPTGPLGLSDPASAQIGIDEAREPGSTDAAAAERAAGDAPAQRAKVGEWRDYAVSRGMTREEADAATKDQLLERFGG